ncbi:hypothetical protein C0J52_15006 [Blattella germanica]|nr:hypothetical protein C0J52_15006 [Blattella germanica]
MKWVAVMVAGLVLVALATAEGEIWEEDDHEVLIRSERGAKSRGKGGSQEKKKKRVGGACRYEKGAWSECSAQNQMTRSDSLKANSDPSCEQSRQITKKCKNKATKSSKGNNNNNPVSNKKIGIYCLSCHLFKEECACVTHKA